MRASNGGGQIKHLKLRVVNPDDVASPPGYKFEMVAKDFTFPSAVAFDEQGTLHVIETGYSYGEVWGEPRLIRVENNGAKTVVARGTRNGPWTGITFHNGFFM